MGKLTCRKEVSPPLLRTHSTPLLQLLGHQAPSRGLYDICRWQGNGSRCLPIVRLLSGMQSRIHQVVVATFLPRIIGLVLDVKSRLQHEVDNSFPGPPDQCSDFVRPSMGWTDPAGLWRSRASVDWINIHEVHPWMDWRIWCQILIMYILAKNSAIHASSSLFCSSYRVLSARSILGDESQV
jgi:hypothetical protein